MQDINFKLAGLTCEACVKLATKRLKKIPGVYEVSVDLATGETGVFSEADLDLDLLEQSLSGTHYSIIR